jgi:hypothetical protein
MTTATTRTLTIEGGWYLGANIISKEYQRGRKLASEFGICITLPLPAVLLTVNMRRRMHWGEQARLTAGQRQDAMLAAYAAMSGTTGLSGILFPSGKVRADVEVFRRPRQKVPDEGAQWEFTKPIWDGFQDAGIVSDDKQIAHGSMVWHAADDDPRVVITLTITEDR